MGVAARGILRALAPAGREGYSPPLAMRREETASLPKCEAESPVFLPISQGQVL